MGVRIRIVAALCVTAAWLGTVHARPTERELIRGALRATGAVESIDVTLGQLRVEGDLDRIERRLGHGRATVRRARRLHDLLQRRYLRRYEPDADGLTEVLDRGAYNCLSATLLYGLAARRLGYDVRVLEHPGHLRLRLYAGERTVDIETTQRDGFDLVPIPEPLSASGAETRAGGIGPGGYRELPLESAVGFAWLNRAWRELEAGRPTSAAEHASAAARDLPAGEGPDADELQRLFARAFRVEYESGRFEEALEIARRDAEAFTGATTSRDRLLAAAAKVIEQESDRGETVRAESILEDTARRLRGTRDAARIVRQMAPVVAAAAVRTGDFPQATRLAERYAAVEPDLVESARLLAWVEERQSDGPAPHPPLTSGAMPTTCTIPADGPVP